MGATPLSTVMHIMVYKKTCIGYVSAYFQSSFNSPRHLKHDDWRAVTPWAVWNSGILCRFFSFINSTVQLV